MVEIEAYFISIDKPLEKSAIDQFTITRTYWIPCIHATLVVFNFVISANWLHWDSFKAAASFVGMLLMVQLIT